MKARTKRYQGGAIISFIVVTIVITAVLVGGIVWLRQRSETARQNEVATNEQELIGEDLGNESTSTSKSDTEKNDQKRRQSSASDSKSATEQKSDVSSTTRGDDREQSSRSSVEHTPSSTDSLPETGPAETAGVLVALGALAYAGTHYVTSRRSLARQR